MTFNRNIIFSIIFIIICLTFSCSLNPAEEKVDPIVVEFPDPNFEALIRETLDIPEGDITNWDMWEITYLRGDSRNITDITGIEYCSGLTGFRLRSNNISNIEPLKDLILLNEVWLQENNIINLKPLYDNTGIGIGDDEIYLAFNPLSNISILEYKPQIQLRGVKVYSNALPTIPSALIFYDEGFERTIRDHLNIPTDNILTSDLEYITNLNGSKYNIKNLYGLENCVNLDSITISNNLIEDIIPLTYLRQTTYINANDNQITNLQPLERFYELTDLYLSYNNIKDISQISNHTNIKNLSLGYNYISNISSLSNMTELQYLDLSGNPINNFGVIQNFDSLNILEINNLEQFDLNYIDELQNLQSLYLSDTPLDNIDHLGSILSLKNLFMDNCNISNIDSLYTLSNLEKLKLNGNGITDITALSNLYNITEIDLGNNAVIDLLPLLNNWGLSTGDYLFLQNNPLNEISINTYIPILESRGVNLIY